MDTRTRNLALRAAWKLAFGTLAASTIGGCGGQVDDGAPPRARGGPSDTERGDSGRTLRDDGGAGEAPALRGIVSGLACTDPVELPESGSARTRPVAPAVASCCEAYLVARAGTDGAPIHPPVSDDPSFANCCRVIVLDSVSNPSVLGFPTYPVRQACCFQAGAIQPGFASVSMCDSWGPPVPPELGAIEGVA